MPPQGSTRFRAPGWAVVALLVALAMTLAACDDPQPQPQQPGQEEGQGVGEEIYDPGIREGGSPPEKACVGGWASPPAGSPLFKRAVALIERGMGLDDGIRVEDIRYFKGPESPPLDKEYGLVVERWYVKGRLKSDDPQPRGRWLVERRTFGAGLVAVAPHDTSGFRSPDWVGFQHEVGSEPKRYEGLPGEWTGTPYNFVVGGKGLKIPGLPAQVSGCLKGT